MINQVIVSLIIMLLVSCKKDPIQYTFSGKITESFSGEALSGASVKISQKTYNGAVVGSVFNPAGSQLTASDGTYQISFDREKVFEFQIETSKSGYFDSEIIISSSEVSTDEVKIVNETLEAQSWIKFDLFNVGGMSTDIFTIVNFNFREGCTGCTTNDYHYFEGVVDSVFTITTTGGIYARYSYKNPGAASYIQDSVYAIPFDTVDVILNY